MPQFSVSMRTWCIFAPVALRGINHGVLTNGESDCGSQQQEGQGLAEELVQHAPVDRTH